MTSFFFVRVLSIFREVRGFAYDVILLRFFSILCFVIGSGMYGLFVSMVVVGRVIIIITIRGSLGGSRSMFDEGSYDTLSTNSYLFLPTSDAPLTHNSTSKY